MAELNLGLADKDKTIMARVGDHIVVRLPENQTTGFRWILTSITEETIILETREVTSPDSESLGAGGDVTFRFNTKAIGLGKVVLKLLRGPQDPTAASEFQFNVDIRNSSSNPQMQRLKDIDR